MVSVAQHAILHEGCRLKALLFFHCFGGVVLVVLRSLRIIHMISYMHWNRSAADRAQMLAAGGARLDFVPRVDLLVRNTTMNACLSTVFVSTCLSIGPYISGQSGSPHRAIQKYAEVRYEQDRITEHRVRCASGVQWFYRHSSCFPLPASTQRSAYAL